LGVDNFFNSSLLVQCELEVISHELQSPDRDLQEVRTTTHHHAQQRKLMRTL
jgi:hypothetical protein